MPSTNGSNKDNSSILVPSITPVGVVLPFAGTTEPTGWLLCYGQTVNRLTYAALFAIIGTTYGAGDGSTTFHLPDLRGRVPAGRDNMGGSAAARLYNTIAGNTLGAAQGAETVTLSIADMPSHNHGGTTGGHSHYTGAFNIGLGYVSGTGGVVITTPGPGTWLTNVTNDTIASQGGGWPHLNIQPTFILNSIIKY